MTLDEEAKANRIEAAARRICRNLGRDPDAMVMRGVPCRVRGAPYDTYFQLPVFPLWESFVDHVDDVEDNS